MLSNLFLLCDYCRFQGHMPVRRAVAAGGGAELRRAELGAGGVPPRLRAAAAESERQLLRVLDVYDGALGRSAYLAGDDFTLADLSHLPNAHYLACSARGRALLASRANVARWYAAISSRPAWRQVVAVQARTAHYPVAFHPSASGHGAV